LNSPVEAVIAIPSEEECSSILRRLRWGDGPVKCVKCGSRRVNKDGVAGHFNKYWCKKCGAYFGDKSGTIFQDTKVPLSKWFMVASLVEEEQTVQEISKLVGLSYRNTYYIAKKLRGSPLTSQIVRILASAAEERRRLPHLGNRPVRHEESAVEVP